MRFICNPFQDVSIMVIVTIILNHLDLGHSWLVSHKPLTINLHRHTNPPLQIRRLHVSPLAFQSPKPSVSTCTTGLCGVIDPSDYPLGKDEGSWKAEGERIIRKAAVEAGASEDIKIEWKSGRIIVTVDGGYAHVDLRGANDGEEDFGDLGEEFYEDDDDSDGGGDGDGKGANVVSIARKINAAFDEEGEDSVGYRVAVHHSIEVTTPGASDELQGIMFESYKGFDVTVEMIDPKKDKKKIVEGKLVERNDDVTIINQKGRMRKLKNDSVISVKLPKAKKEKGGR